MCVCLCVSLYDYEETTTAAATTPTARTAAAAAAAGRTTTTTTASTNLLDNADEAGGCFAPVLMPTVATVLTFVA